MKKFSFVFALILFLSIPAFSQKVGDLLYLYDMAKLSTFPKSAEEILVPQNSVITILKEVNDTGYYYVKTIKGEGYLPASFIANELLQASPTYKKNKEEESKKYQKEYALKMKNDIIGYYKDLYGKPDRIDDYNSGSYISKTLVWYCAGSKYRSIDFRYSSLGRWVKESEYESDCIK